VDLGDRARDLGLKTHGLRNLAANLLGYRISKQARVSNWASDNLTEKQIRYAATDAWVSREIYLAMEKLGFFLPSDE
jgi:ribonuclease D